MVDRLLKALNLDEKSESIQKIQLAHRLKIIDFWKIENSSHVLEVGCGQGETTVALAYTVGSDGAVCGIDIASPDYGAPETLGQARDRILQSEFGDIIQMHFNFNITKDSLPFDESEFDSIVLSHCLWYLSSYDELIEVLTNLKRYGKRLCIAEWNPHISLPEQVPHYQAATIQAICEMFTHSDTSNIKTMFFPSQIENALQESGWTIERTGSTYSPEMQDGLWEVSTVTSTYPQKINSDSLMPQKLKNLLLSQINVLEAAAEIKPMATFCVTAIR